MQMTKLCLCPIIGFYSEPEEILPHSELSYQFVLRSLIIPDCGHFLLSQNTMLVCGLDIFTGSRAQPVLPHVLAHASEGSRFSSGQGCVFYLDSGPRLHLPTNTEWTHNSLSKSLERHDTLGTPTS